MLYIPDQDEIARSAPKSAPLQLNLSSSSSDHFPSSVESEGTIRSSSVSQPLPDPQEEESRAEGGESPAEGGESPVEPYNRDELFEEVTDSHMVLVSRYISDDQVSA